MPIQLPLQFEFTSNQNFSTFYPGKNLETITHLKQIFANHEQLIFIWGNAGSGKTHLLQAANQNAKNFAKRAFYFSLDLNELPDASILSGLENIDLVCFDNIDKIANNTDWEQAFFNFYNLHRENNNILILSASCPPKYLSIQLADLKTRMNWGLTLKLQSLSDQQLLEALIFKAKDSGFNIPVKVARFLINHYTSDLPSIWLLFAKIEQATLSEKRKLTIPFLKKIMANPKNKES